MALSRLRSSRPSAPSTEGPKVATTAASPGVLGSTTSRAISSVSMTGTPSDRKTFAAALLPLAMPPVSPTRKNARPWVALAGGCSGMTDARHPEVTAGYFRAPHEADPAGRRKVRSEWNRQLPVPPAKDNERDADNGPGGRGHQHDWQHHLPAHPGAEGGQQLEVAVAHALFSGQELEKPVHAPEAEVTRRCPGDRCYRIDRQSETDVLPSEARACHETDPAKRKCQAVRQELGVDIDRAHRDQEPGDGEAAERRPPESEMPGDGRRQASGEQLDDGIADRDSRAAAGAPAAQDEVAEYRDVVDGPDLLAAGRAAAARGEQIESRQGGALLAVEFGALLAPVAIHHDGQTIDDDVQEAADRERQHEYDGAEERRGFAQELRGFHPGICLDLKAKTPRLRPRRLAPVS